MKKIAIIGGGISGLYFANLLQKNQNYQYKVFEKKSQFKKIIKKAIKAAYYRSIKLGKVNQ